jgi:hypothetical protein
MGVGDLNGQRLKASAAFAASDVGELSPEALTPCCAQLAAIPKVGASHSGRIAPVQDHLADAGALVRVETDVRLCITRCLTRGALLATAGCVV